MRIFRRKLAASDRQKFLTIPREVWTVWGSVVEVDLAFDGRYLVVVPVKPEGSENASPN